MASVFAKLNFVEKFNKLGPTKTSDEIKEVRIFYLTGSLTNSWGDFWPIRALYFLFQIR